MKERSDSGPYTTVGSLVERRDTFDPDRFLTHSFDGIREVLKTTKSRGPYCPPQHRDPKRSTEGLGLRINR